MSPRTPSTNSSTSDPVRPPDGPGDGPLLRARNLSFGYGDRSFLRGVSLEVEAGRCCALLGANGAGKTTLLRLLCGVLRPHRGDVELLGRSLGELDPRERARHLGFLPQATPSAGGFAVFEVVLMGMYSTMPARGWESVREWRAVVESLRRVGAGALLRRRFGELSGGEQRRVLLARAMVSRPAVLALDEPLASLDPGFGLELLEHLQRLKEEGTGMVVATHDLGLVQSLADHAVLLRRGRPLASGPTGEVLTSENLDSAYGTDAFGRRRATAGQAWLPPSRV